MNLMRIRLMRSLGAAPPNRRSGARGWSGVPSVFKCHPGGYDDYVMVHIRGDAWETVLAVIGREDLIGDERYSTDEDRGQRAEEVDAIITEWSSGRTKYEAFEALAAVGVWSGAVLSPEETLTNEHLIAREMIVDVEDEVRGDYTVRKRQTKVSRPCLKEGCCLVVEFILIRLLLFVGDVWII